MHISYFYKKLHFLRHTTKFGSQDLDLYNSTYHFSKFASNLKTDELAFSIESLTAGALGSVDPTCQLRRGMGQPKFTDGDPLRRWHRPNRDPHDLPHLLS